MSEARIDINRGLLSRPHPIAAAGSPSISLRTKALLAILALALYLLVVGVVVSGERDKLHAVVDELTDIRSSQEALVSANTLVAHAVFAFNAVSDTGEVPDSKALLLDVEGLQLPLRALLPAYPKGKAPYDEFMERLRLAHQDPSRDNLGSLQLSLYKIVKSLEEPNQTLYRRERELVRRFDLSYDAVTWLAVGLGVLGIALFGALTTLFFGRLAFDVRRLERRAREIVRGYRGEPLPVTRSDEVGGLIHAVNDMVVELDQREKDLVIERQKVFHQEKMAALGALATGLLHEIGNPIAAIDGVARAIDDVQEAGHCPHSRRFCRSDLILQQTARLSAIAHDISAFARPQPAERQLVDVNGLIQSACSLMRYDRRLRQIELRFDMDKELPAVVAAPDRLTQVLMNLISNAADALQGPRTSPAFIQITTRFEEGKVSIVVADNGHGIAPEVMGKVFEPFFTTKPAGKGTGLGLPISRSIIEEQGGTIAIESAPAQGTTVRISFPLQTTKL